MLVEPIKGSWQWVPSPPSPEPQSQLPQPQPQQPSEPAPAPSPTTVSPVELTQEIHQVKEEQPQPAIPTLVIGTPPAPSPQQNLEQQLNTWSPEQIADKWDSIAASYPSLLSF